MPSFGLFRIEHRAERQIGTSGCAYAPTVADRVRNAIVHRLHEVDGEHQPAAKTILLHEARGLRQPTNFVSALTVRIKGYLGHG
jgi:hypothetical protein